MGLVKWGNFASDVQAESAGDGFRGVGTWRGRLGPEVVSGDQVTFVFELSVESGYFSGLWASLLLQRGQPGPCAMGKYSGEKDGAFGLTIQPGKGGHGERDSAHRNYFQFVGSYSKFFCVVCPILVDSIQFWLHQYWTRCSVVQMLAGV